MPRTRAQQGADLAALASRAPEITLVKVLTALARYGQFASAASAAREVLSFGLVCKGWLGATKHELVWKTLATRASPAHTRAVAEAMPAYVTETVRDRWDEEDVEVTTAASILARSRHFAASFMSPFLAPPVQAASASTSFRATFRHRLLAAQHAERSYRACGDPRRHIYRCTTAAQPGVDLASIDLDEVSFIVELFELDAERRSRQRWLDDIVLRERDDTGSYYDGIDYHDFVTDKLRMARAGPPHYAARRDLGPLIAEPEAVRRIYLDRGPETENLLWAATVRADQDGDVVAPVPLDDEGKIPRRYTLPINTGHDGSGECMTSWRVVVTAVREYDGKCCQLVDVRGYRRPHDQPFVRWPDQSGLRQDADNFGADTRVVVADNFDVEIQFSHNKRFGPPTQGASHHDRDDCNQACRAFCGPFNEEGYLAEPGSDEEIESVVEPQLEGADAVAKRAFDTFEQSGGHDVSAPLTCIAMVQGGVGREPVQGGRKRLERNLARIHWS